MFLVAVMMLTMLASCDIINNIIGKDDKEIVSVDVLNIPEDGIFVGQFDEANIQLKVIYDDGTTETVPLKEADIPAEEATLLGIPGTHTFEALYRGVEYSYTLTIKSPTCEITFVNLNDEVIKKNTYNFIDGTPEIVPPTAEEMTVLGYRFTGEWDKSLDGITEDTVIKGIYVKTYTVSFYNGRNELISTQTVDAGTDAVEPALEDRYVEGYVWKSWDRSFTNVQKDISVYGIYVKGYALVYRVDNSAHGYVTGNVESGSEVTVGNSITVTATPYANYMFEGWYLDGERVSTDSEYTFVMFSRSMELIAKFTALSEDCTHDYKGIVINPTCTEQGYTTYTCDKCGDSYVGDYINALGHDYVNGTCTRCGAIEPKDYNDKQYIRCDKDGTPNEEGSYILFGEYPQTIKADDVTITDVQDSRGYYLGSDGFYYAKVTASPKSSEYTFSTGDVITNGEVYYFKVEPIRWRILIEYGEPAFILCDSVIANQRYDDDSNNYAESEIRAWLNSIFYQTAFNELQREIILTTTVDNSVYSTGYSSNPNVCEDTYDKIFLLSYREATHGEYGFSTSSVNDDAREILTSDYSRAMGTPMNSDSSEYYGNGIWWLRSPIGNYTSHARYVRIEGDVYEHNNNYVYRTYGVVPAMWISLNP